MARVVAATTSGAGGRLNPAEEWLEPPEEYEGSELEEPEDEAELCGLGWCEPASLEPPEDEPSRRTALSAIADVAKSPAIKATTACRPVIVASRSSPERASRYRLVQETCLSRARSLRP